MQKFRHQSIRSGLVGHWRPSRGPTAYTLFDSIGGNHGELVGAVWELLSGGGKGGYTLYTDGISKKVTFAALPAISTAATQSYWFRRFSASQHGPSVGVGTVASTANRFAIQVWSDGEVYISFGGSNWGNFTTNDTALHHLSVTYDGDETGNSNRLKSYLDGRQVSLSFTGTIPSSIGAFNSFRVGQTYTGDAGDNDPYSWGYFDDYSIHDRALTPGEISTLFNEGRGALDPIVVNKTAVRRLAAPGTGSANQTEVADSQTATGISSLNAAASQTEPADSQTATGEGPPPDFIYMIPITVDHTKVSNTNQTDFPVCVSAINTALKHNTYGGHVTSLLGYDIRFYSDAGLTTALSYELQKYNPVTGEIYFHVKIPTLSTSVDTVFYMTYGDSAITTDGSSTGAWNSNFKSVVHLGNQLGIERSAANPIINYGGGGWKNMQVQEPCILVDPSDSTKLIMFYAGMDGLVPAMGKMRIGRATADVSDPTTWTEYGSNPIVGVGGSGAWDEYYVRCDSVVYDSGTYYMYFSGGNASAIDQIGLATSTDGFTFTKHASNPIITPTGQGRNDGTNVSQGAVLKEGSNWYMYYSYRNGGSILPGIRYATSTDGITWTKAGSGDIITKGSTNTYDDTYIEWHQVFKDNGVYYILYEGYQTGGTAYTTWRAHIASATSPTGTWTKATSPVFSPSYVAGAFDQFHVATPALYKIDGLWWFYYQGGNTLAYASANWAMGVCTLGTMTPADLFTTPMPVNDATSNGNDFTLNLPINTDNAADKAFSAGDFDGLSTKPHQTTLVMPTTGTLAVLVKFKADPTNVSLVHSIFESYAGPGSLQLFDLLDFQGTLYGGWYNAGNDDRVTWSISGMSPYVWYQITLTWTNGGTTELSVDGVSKATTAGLNATWDTSTGDTYLGYEPGGNTHLWGSLAEFRISDVVRSTDWIITEKNNLLSPETFLSLGAEEIGNIDGAASQTELDDVQTAAGTLSINGSATQTELDDTQTATGTTALSGAASQTELDDTVNQTGSLSINGSASQTELDDTQVATGTLTNLISGSAAQTELDDTSVGSGSILIAGFASQTELDDTVDQTGTLGNSISGSANQTEPADSQSATASLSIQGSGTQTEPADSQIVTASLSVDGDATQTEPADTQTATGTTEETSPLGFSYYLLLWS